MLPRSLSADIARLLELPAEEAAAIEGTVCGGGNNRVYVARVGGRRYVVKQYYRHPSDRRDRLGTEERFLRFAQACGIGCVPRVVTTDAAKALGIYEYIEGEKLGAGKPSATQVRQAADFFLRLNNSGDRYPARNLPDASEACFSIEQHFAMVDGRLARLRAIVPASDVDAAAMDFIAELVARWQDVKRDIESGAARLDLGVSDEIEEVCISPSDFGFHNALLRPDGDVCFLDFEYAGRDDPAKMVGDFFLTSAIPVPYEHFDNFVERTMAFSREPQKLTARSRLLLPVFQTKWCCIILNEFIAEGARRRSFAQPLPDEGMRKRGQLQKAKTLFASIPA